MVRDAQQLGQAILLSRNGDEVHVVGHQAVSPDRCSGANLVLAYQRKVLGVIIVAEEGRLLAIAALGHMVGKAGHNEARHSGHLCVSSVFVSSGNDGATTTAQPPRVNPASLCRLGVSAGFAELGSLSPNWSQSVPNCSSRRPRN